MRSSGLVFLCLAILSAASATGWAQEEDVRKGFHGNPLKRGQAESVEVDEGLREYREILQDRCVRCHSGDRIDAAIRQQLPFESVEEILLKRNVVLSEQERNVLGTFWGNPLKVPRK